MDTELIKFLVDLGSISAIVIIVSMFLKYLREERETRLEEHKQFMETIVNLSKEIYHDN